MGELRVGSAQETSRTRPPAIQAGDMSIPVTEFDFARSNARFDKVDGESVVSEERGSGKSGERETAYNPKASFFDTLGSTQNGAEEVAVGGRGGGRGRGNRRGGSKREEERQKNVATFGEPGGGPGLMGRGAYVGWRGNRRGQGRGVRRGTPRPQVPLQ